MPLPRGSSAFYCQSKSEQSRTTCCLHSVASADGIFKAHKLAEASSLAAVMSKAACLYSFVDCIALSCIQHSKHSALTYLTLQQIVKKDGYSK